MKSASIFLVIGAMLLAVAACAPTNVETAGEVGGQMPKPDRILVYDFAVSPDEVKLDSGLGGEVKAYLAQYDTGTSRTAGEIQIGHSVANALADELVKQLRAGDLPAERASGTPATGGNVLMIKGQLLSIDEGNRTERVVIGLGAGRTDVRANVQIYELTHGGTRELESMKGDAKSGYKPGMAETMGAGAVAAHLLVSTLVSGGLTAVSETVGATVDADGQRLAKDVAKNLELYFGSQGWLPLMPP